MVFRIRRQPIRSRRPGRSQIAKQLEARGLSPEEVFEGYAALATIVTPAIISPTIAKDPVDDVVLATALAAQADAIVSGDADLRDLKQYLGIPILAAAETFARMPQR